MTTSSQGDTITFYIHPYFWPKGELPETADVDWPGFGFGPYIWTIQTYLRLARAGVACTLTSIPPTEGILLAHRESLSAINGYFREQIHPGKRLFVVDLAADLAPFLGANIHIVQNPQQALRYANHFYIRHWPQPGLIPRDPVRGGTFENVAYLGADKNLAPELRSREWEVTLRSEGFNLVGRSQTFDHLDPATYHRQGNWSDYSDVDVIVAIRNFAADNQFDHKPASKLYNAWIAGVPAILGRESAYLCERKSELDYLEATSARDVMKHLQALRENPGLRNRMVANGFERAKEIDASATVQAWIRLIDEVIRPAHRNWVAMGKASQAMRLKLSAAQFQLQRIIARAGRMGLGPSTLPPPPPSAPLRNPPL